MPQLLPHLQRRLVRHHRLRLSSHYTDTLLAQPARPQLPVAAKRPSYLRATDPGRLCDNNAKPTSHRKPIVVHQLLPALLRRLVRHNRLRLSDHNPNAARSQSDAQLPEPANRSDHLRAELGHIIEHDVVRQLLSALCRRQLPDHSERVRHHRPRPRRSQSHA